MAARESEAMKRAKTLVMVKGLTAYAAAKQVGLTRHAIYMSQWYKDFKAQESSK